MSNVLVCFNNLSSYLGTPLKDVKFNEDSLPVRTIDTTTITGFINIVTKLAEESSSSDLYRPVTSLDKAELWQWLEYAFLYVNQINNNNSLSQVLKELNERLQLKTYLIANKLSIADITLYYFLYNNVKNLDENDKEKYINLFRWFDNIQQNKNIRQKNKIINFGSNCLVYAAPNRHL